MPDQTSLCLDSKRQHEGTEHQQVPMSFPGSHINWVVLKTFIDHGIGLHSPFAQMTQTTAVLQDSVLSFPNKTFMLPVCMVESISVS